LLRGDCFDGEKTGQKVLRLWRCKRE
jgi:hypothetical protein